MPVLHATSLHVHGYAVTEDFASHLKTRRFRRPTITAYMASVRLFAEHAWDAWQRGLMESDADLAHEWFCVLAQQGVKNETVRRHGAALRSLWAWLGRSPESIKIVPNTSSRAPVPVGSASLDDIVHQLHVTTRHGARWRRECDAVVLSLITRAGLTASELIAVRTQDLVLPEVGSKMPGQLRVARHGHGSVRWVSLDDTTCLDLRLWLSSRSRLALLQTDCLIVSDRRGPITRQGLWKRLRDLAARAGLPRRSLHALKMHGIADRLRAGESPKDVARDVGMTEPERLRRMARTLAASCTACTPARTPRSPSLQPVLAAAPSDRSSRKA